jgi:hypothetical protein
MYTSTALIVTMVLFVWSFAGGHESATTAGLLREVAQLGEKLKKSSERSRVVLDVGGHERCQIGIGGFPYCASAAGVT